MKKKAKLKKPENKIVPPRVDVKVEESEDSVGLPDMDFKKFMGCGG